MIGFELNKAKGMFFDRPAVQGAVDRATRHVLSRFGAFVRTRSRSSIRRAKGTSRPGRPPHAHTGLVKKILFGYDPERQSVVIGPMRLNQKTGDALPALEYGGRSRVEMGSRRRRRLERNVTIRPRPFMGPALVEEQKKLPALWAGSVKR